MLKSYSGVRRRFEIKYKTSNNITIIDDYAHHPSEVAATIKAAKLGWNKRLISIFQPHLFTRTRDFYKDFSQALDRSDIVIITDSTTTSTTITTTTATGKKRRHVGKQCS